ncbi:MAG: hypothetical protein ABIP68_09645 [Ferruginibacter sp.]
MKVIFDFETYNSYIKEDEPLHLAVDDLKIIPIKGDTVSYNFKDGSGDISFIVVDRSFIMVNDKINRLVVYLQRT